MPAADKARRFRATAERIRELAVRLRSGDARRELLDLASRFERLAARSEAAFGETAEPPPRPGVRAA